MPEFNFSIIMNNNNIKFIIIFVSWACLTQKWVCLFAIIQKFSGKIATELEQIQF